jgi:hypothetical protein
MSPRIEKLREAVEVMHRVKARHLRSVPFKEVFRGATVWEGVVEVFAITGHPKAKCCYAWSYHDGKEDQFTTVLEIPPVDSPQSAVRASIVAAGKRA